MQHWPADISFWRIMKQPLHMQSNRVYRHGLRVVTPGQESFDEFI